MEITTKQFRKETDLDLVWNFMVEIYDRWKGGGVAAPFFEYALFSSWILRIKDNCEAFDPAACRKMMDPQDVTKNIGIRMVFNAAKSVSYQSVFGLNVLIITI